MRIAVIGAGGVGGFLGARLVEAEFDVTVVARGEHARALKRDGLLIHAAGGEHRVVLPKIVTAEQLDGVFDLVCLAVKWRDLEEVCAEAARVIAARGLVLPLLNGLEAEDVCARFVGAQRTLAAVAYMSSGITAPGEIYVHGHARLGLSPYREGQAQDLERAAACFERARVPVRRHADYRSMLWEKMVWNAPFNAICALTQKTAGQVADELSGLVREAMQEVIRVAAAEGVELPAVLADGMLQLTRAEFPNTLPSMLQDVRSGRPTEVEVLQGAVVARAQAAGVAVPVLRTLADLVRGLTAPGR